MRGSVGLSRSLTCGPTRNADIAQSVAVVCERPQVAQPSRSGIVRNPVLRSRSGVVVARQDSAQGGSVTGSRPWRASSSSHRTPTAIPRGFSVRAPSAETRTAKFGRSAAYARRRITCATRHCHGSPGLRRSRRPGSRTRMNKISYSGYPFPPEIIQQAIWLYLRFTPSLRDVEDLLAERGVAVSYETVRRWVNHFGPMNAADLRKRRLKPHTTWHLDEVYLKIDGRMVYLWRAVDAEGEVLDVLVQSERNKHAALKLMQKLLKKYAFVPEQLVTDDLRSYSAGLCQSNGRSSDLRRAVKISERIAHDARLPWSEAPRAFGLTGPFLAHRSRSSRPSIGECPPRPVVRGPNSQLSC